MSEMLYPTSALKRMPIETQPYLELYCHLELFGLLIPLGFNLILILLCSYFGFRTRTLPDNFNESKFIFFSVISTTFLWVMFLPTYFTTFYAIYKTILLASSLVINARITLVSLFVPKVFAVYFVANSCARNPSNASEGRNTSVSTNQSSTFEFSMGNLQ